MSSREPVQKESELEKEVRFISELNVSDYGLTVYQRLLEVQRKSGLLFAALVAKRVASSLNTKSKQSFDECYMLKLAMSYFSAIGIRGESRYTAEESITHLMITACSLCTNGGQELTKARRGTALVALFSVVKTHCSYVDSKYNPAVKAGDYPLPEVKRYNPKHGFKIEEAFCEILRCFPGIVDEEKKEKMLDLSRKSDEAMKAGSRGSGEVAKRARSRESSDTSERRSKRIRTELSRSAAAPPLRPALRQEGVGSKRKHMTVQISDEVVECVTFVALRPFKKNTAEDRARQRTPEYREGCKKRNDRIKAKKAAAEEAKKASENEKAAASSSNL